MPTYSCSLKCLFGLISLLARDTSARCPKVVQMPITRMNNGEPFIPALSVTLGTPPQKVLALLDSGSSDFWVPKTNSTLCKDKEQQCSGKPFVTGSYDPRSSTTFAATPNAPPFFTNYVNGVSINGTFMDESVTFGNTTIAKLQVGLGNRGVLPSALFPIAGLGYADFEGVIQTTNKSYVNTVASMKAKGLIKSTSFGLYLNDFRAEQGSIVFGGYDSAKFTGNLTAIPLSPDTDGGFTTFFVSWTSFEFQPGQNDCAGSNNKRSIINLAPAKGLPDALFDSGNPGISIDPAVLETMGEGLGLKVINQSLETLPCAAVDPGDKLIMGFNGNVSLEVPVSMMLVPVTDETGQPATDSNGNSMCQLPVSGSPGSGSLGAPFLQAAYVVFDMDSNKLLVAQAAVNATNTQLHEYP